MFLMGHFGVGFALKPVAPKLPLWALLLASELLDILSFGFVAAGIESSGEYQISLNQGLLAIVPESIPWSHGLMTTLLWYAIALTIGWVTFKQWRAGAILGLAAFSHWALDFIVHASDLPIQFGSSQTVGLGLWSTGSGLVAAMALEFIILGAGLTVYYTWRRRRRNASSLSIRPAKTTKTYWRKLG